MKKRLFQYAVVVHTKDTDGKIEASEMVIAPTTKMAGSEKELLFQITREIPEKYTTDPDNVEIMIRNF